MNIHSCIKVIHRFTASYSAKTLYSISFIIHAYYNGGSCITCGASGKKSIHFALGKSDHIVGVVSPPNKSKGYWTNDKHTKSADKWLETAEFHQGSWWTDWFEWIKPRLGELVSPPSMGSQAYPPIVPASGTYVLEK